MALVQRHPGVEDPECWSRLLPGDSVLLWYSDDTVWHEAVILWRFGNRAVILTPDGDVYHSPMFGDPDDGPSRILAVGRDGSLPGTGRGSLYRFDGFPTEDELKAHIRAAKAMAVSASGDLGLRIEDHEEVVKPDGEVVSIDAFFGGNFLTRRLRGRTPAVQRRRSEEGTVPDEPQREQGERPQTPGSVADASQGALQLLAGPGCAWVVCELGSSLELGKEVTLGPGDVRLDHRGLHRYSGQVVPVEVIQCSELASYATRRLAELESLLRAKRAQEPATEPTPTGPDLRQRLGLSALPEADRDLNRTEESAGADIRTLWIDYDSQGARYKEWVSVTNESFSHKFEDSPVEGPGTCLHLTRHWQRHGGNPRLWLDIWCRSKGIGKQERVYHELVVLLEIFYVGGTFDQVNMPCLVSFEVAARRIQTIIDAYADPTKPSWTTAPLFSGVSSADDLVAPELRHFASKRAKEEADVESIRNKGRALLAVADAVATGGLPAPKATGGAGAAGAKGRGKGKAALTAPAP